MVHTWSVFIGGMGMLQILLSLPVTYTVYSLFVPYFSQMHILATFLVLGVGADDVFVLTDGWKQSVRDVIPVPGETRRERLQRRMAYAYGRTASAVFNTSFTTAMAFVSTAISPIMTISAFGAFAAIAILVNYVMVITWLPAIILAAEIHIWPRCNKLCKTKCFKWGPQDDAAWSDLSAIDDTGVPLEEESVSCIDKAFEKGYGKCMMKHTCEKRLRGSAEADAADGARPLTCSVCRFRPFATLSFVAILAWAIVMVYWTLQLSPPTKAEAFFPDAHMSTGITDLMSDAYLGGGSDSYTGGVFFVGLEKLDRENKGTSDIPFNKYDPDYNRGSVEFDPDFDLYPTANQDYLVGFCDKLDKKVCHEDGDAGKPKLEACTGANQLLVRQGSLECFIREFHKWHEAEFNGTQANDNTAVTRSEFKERLLKFRKSEVPNTGEAGASWKNSIGVLKDAKTGEQEIKYVSFAFTSTMAKRRPIGIKQPLYDMTEKMISEFVADAPKGLTHMGQSFGHQGWVWMETEKALVAGLMNGLAICFPIAFLVLAVATRNLILSVIATLSIGFIVASVLGSVKLFYGWDLGIAETIAGIIVIGFSVDYVVHMGHMYIEASEKSGAMTREKRFYYAASKMGSTVMAGAITTAGSGAFMFVCQMRFFYKMAILITMTIGYSFVFSFGFFMAFLVIAGPEYDESNLGVPCGLSLVKEAAHIMNDRKKAMKQLRNARGLDDDAKTAGLMEGGSDAPKTAAEDDDDDGELNGDEIRGWKANAAKNGKASI